ncbi:MAG: CocE/NonD family hydrolase, partial [Roseomonas mucosa]|nr:CocE/NonD family hydrolase [Roseomonas mucosa]
MEAVGCPAIMSWAPYGKRGAALNFDAFGHPNRMDVHRDWEDGLEAFEGPVPAYWVSMGYAVLNPDPRGVFNSEGDIWAWGEQDALDCYDFIEWLAQREWCNGKVGLTGVSWLAMTQYYIAAANPPHLAAIAPWEGVWDLYREAIVRGGIPDMTFNEAIFSVLFGNNMVEDLSVMTENHPLFDAYWKGKVAKLEKITVPAYVVASWTSMLHAQGSVQAWKHIASREKWLRTHDTMEWPNYFNPAHVEDLRRFFDYYLKGVENDWPSTPRVRLTVLDPGNESTHDRVEADFPLAHQHVRTLYLSDKEGDYTLDDTSPDISREAVYSSEQGEKVVFSIKFDEVTEITGYINLKLWVEARGHDDMDIFAYVRKRDRNG